MFVAPQLHWGTSMTRRVIDGDTFETTVDGKEVTIRLANVGAPEAGEPGSKQATRKLRKLLGTEPVTFEQHAVDPWGRLVCTVTNADGVNVNDAMQAYLGGYSGR